MKGDSLIWLNSNCSFYECKLYQWFWSDWSRSTFSPCLLPPWLWFPWRLEDDWLHINSEPKSCGCHGAVALTLRLSLSVSASVVPFPYQPQFDCCCTVTQPTLQRAAQASSTLPLEGALESKLHREKWFWFYWEYKMFYQNPFTGF